MDESVTVSESQPVDWGRAWVRSSANRAGQARVSIALCRSLSLVGTAVPPWFNTPLPTWRTLQTHAAHRSLQAAQPPRSYKQPFPRSFARVRARETLGVREKGGRRGWIDSGGKKKKQQRWMLMMGCELPRLGMFSCCYTTGWCWRKKIHIFYIFKKKKK